MSVSPKSFKTLLGKVNPDFAGMIQHDAHELLNLLLDKLHEDLNRVQKKPYTEKVEGEGKLSSADDRALAKEQWRRVLLRDDSVVTEVCGGLMRESLTCMVCNRQTCCFQYGTMVEVSVHAGDHGEKKKRSFRVLFIPEYPANDKGDKIDHAFENPTVYDFSESELTTSQDLKVRLAHLIPDTYLRSSGGEILLLESGSASETSHDNTTLGAAAWAMVRKPINDSEPLSLVKEDAWIFAYCPHKDMQNRVIVSQRLVEPVLIHTGDTMNGTSPSSPNYSTTSTDRISAAQSSDSFDKAIRLQLTGWPVLISCDPSWSPRRLRFQIWKNVVKWHSPDSAGYKSCRAALANEKNILEQFKLSDNLHIRSVDFRGNSVTVNDGKESRDSMEDIYAERSSFCSEVCWGSIGAIGAADGEGNAGTPYKQKDESRRLMIQEARKRSVENWSKQVQADMAIGHLESHLGAALVIGDKKAKIADLFSAESILFFAVDWLGTSGGSFNTALSNKYLPPSLALRNRVGANNGLSLQNCLRNHTTEEVLEDGNEVYCSKCEECKSSRKRIQFYRPCLPKTLIVTFKRFDSARRQQYRGMQYTTRDKIDLYVDFPMDGLDLLPYCYEGKEGGSEGEYGRAGDGKCMDKDKHDEKGCDGRDGKDVYDMKGTEDDTNDSSSPSSSSSSSSSSSPRSTLYDLFAVVNHYGRMGYGHYTSSAREVKWEGDGQDGPHGQWYHYDDDDVTIAARGETEDALHREVITNNAYILFYRRRGS